MKKNYFLLGNKEYRDKNYNAAIDFYNKSLKENKFYWCYHNLALTHLKNGDSDKAKKVLREAISLSEHNYKDYDIVLVENGIKIIKKVEDRLDLPVSDLIVKLWGGFSYFAEKDLIDFLRNTENPENQKAQAVIALARWFANKSEWEKSVIYLELLKNIDIKAYGSKRIKILLIEAYLNTGKYESAKKIIDDSLNDEVDNDFLCALNNFFSYQTDTAKKRIDVLNAIYENAGLSRVELIDENSGLFFGNIGYGENGTSKIKNGPKISILMPIYNAREFLDVAIFSLLNQTWQNIEIIAIDDGSTDGSWELLLELRKLDDRLKIYKNDQNMGAYPTRNKALSLSTGEYITVHDSDDWSHPQMLEAQMDVMLRNKSIKITFSYMVRAYPNLKFMIRPQRDNWEYIHRSYPSLLIKKVDLEKLGEWDAVAANADDEFVQRAQKIWGKESIVDVQKNVPFSMFLVHPNSLTQQAGTNLNTLTFGIRKEYARQASYWRDKNKDSLRIKRNSLKDPFPIPAGLAQKNWKKNNKYDLIIVSDLSLLGEVYRINEGYISAALSMGWKVGLFHWPHYELRMVDIAKEYTDLSYQENVDILVPEDDVVCDVLMIHHPAILRYEIDGVPKVKCKKVGILVDQSPMQLWSERSHSYCPKNASELIKRIFGVKPTWIPISERVLETLNIVGGYESVYDKIWYPPYNHSINKSEISLPEGLGTSRKIILGRHSGDHWTKWPGTTSDLRAAYCVDAENIKFRVLGGAKIPANMLEAIPSNWEVLDSDSVSVSDFIKGLDFFVYYTNSDCIEDFERNIIEAMALGRLVILPSKFKDIFKDAAVYAQPMEVEAAINYYWSNQNAYFEQVAKGMDFVKRNCSLWVVKSNLRSFVLN